MRYWSADDLQSLLDTLRDADYRVVGPVVNDGTMQYGDISELPVGWGDEQEAGYYRLSPRDDRSHFGFTPGASSWKQFLFPPEEEIFRVRDGEFISSRREPEAMAFIGVRACELAAIAIQDQVFGSAGEPGYLARREKLLLVAVNCSQAASTCFCTSSGDGPAVASDSAADLVLTECNPQQPYYLAEARTDRGRDLLEAVGGREATQQEALAITQQTDAARAQMHRSLERSGLRDRLLSSLADPHWDDLAQRCLACGNCTQVCPTCFCNTTEEKTDPVTLEVGHTRRWESCFSERHSLLSGGAVHRSVRSRYRQWLTHKLASWEDQFGRSGCTGCGRCITWCPVGIDLTREAAALGGRS